MWAPDQDGSRFVRRDAWAEAGMVYAVDINPEAIRHIEERAKKEELQNVKTILGKADDPVLPAGSVDAVLLLKTYHEVAQPVACCGTCAGLCVRERRSESLTAMETAKTMGSGEMS